MNARTIAAVMALVPVALSAQSDPISGKWGRGGGDGGPVLELRLESGGAVTGQVMNGRPGNMAPIKSGIFSRQTGALRLEGDARNQDAGAMTAYLIQGNLVGDSLKGTATFGDYRGTFAFTRLTSTQAAPSALEELGKSFAEVSAVVMKSAEMVPADKYSYKPVATVRTFGELAAHVADSYVWYCTRASGRNVEWSDAIEKGRTDKATVTQKLRESLAICSATYANSSSHVGGLINNIGHTNLHYGNMITYLRMMGLVPPSS
jgi:uncharacterized damage-inducible protein DinB